MSSPDRIEGLAIVSADGMIANRDGAQPDALKLDADQHFFHEMCDAATALAHGRNSSEGGPRMAGRRRLVLTYNIASLARHPELANAVLWNPAGATLKQAWDMLGLSGGLLAVIGGTEPFGLFLERGYDAFHLSTASHAWLPGGRPVFPGIPPRTPEELLAQHGLKPKPVRVLDASHGLSLATWSR
jgi:dihydrofolate reductase